MRERVLLSLILLATCSGCTNLFFYPYKEKLLIPSEVGIPFSEVSVPRDSNSQLFGWRLTTPTALFPKPRALLLFLHGNAGNISNHLGTVAWLPKEGIEVVTMDYSGYGNSDGEISIDQIHADAELLFKTFSDEARQRDLPFLVLGESLGATVALYTSRNVQTSSLPKCLVAVAPFSGYRKIAREKLASFWLTFPLQWPLGFLIDDSYSPGADTEPLVVPTLFVHGTTDQVVPIHHSELLASRRRSECTRLYRHEGSHDGPMIDRKNQEVVSDFLSSQCCLP